MHPLEFDELLLEIAELEPKQAVAHILKSFNASQAEAARRCNFAGWQIGSQTISNWITGRTQPSIHAIEQLASTLMRDNLSYELQHLGYWEFNPRKYQVATLRKMLALAKGWNPEKIEDHFSLKEIALAKKRGLLPD